MLDLACNSNKTACIVLTPKSRNRLVSSEFPPLKIGDTFIEFVDSLRYLGHYTVSGLSDDTDIGLLREIRHYVFSHQ